MKQIQLKYCTIEWRDFGCATFFPDGTHVNAVAHKEPHYYVIAHRCGYQDDILAYCREHDFCHAFLMQELMNSISPVLASQAGKWHISSQCAAMEEMAVQMFQRWLRGNEEPIISGVDWHKLKAKALKLLSD